MISIRRVFILFLGLVLGSLMLFSCEERIDLDLDNTASQLVIEGYVTTKQGPYEVSISRTKEYFSSNDFPGVTGATVIIRDDSNQVDTLTPGDSAGIYKTNDLKGIPGRNYFLKVLLDGNQYTAKTYLPDSVPIDSLNYCYKESSTFQDAGYFILLNGPEPDTAGNHYRAKVYKNDSLFDGRFDYVLNNDQLVNGVYIRTEMPFVFEPGDTARVDLVNIDDQFYNFYESLIEQFQAGSPFAPPGDNVRSNIKGGAFGYFGGKGIATERVVLPEEKVCRYPQGPTPD
jgi:hypothetical protein